MRPPYRRWLVVGYTDPLANASTLETICSTPSRPARNESDRESDAAPIGRAQKMNGQKRLYHSLS